MSYAKRGTVVTEASQRDDPAAYQRLYRAKRPKYVERNNALTAAHHAARARLARCFQEEYRVLLADECARRGIDPPDDRYSS